MSRVDRPNEQVDTNQHEFEQEKTEATEKDLTNDDTDKHGLGKLNCREKARKDTAKRL